MITNDMHLQAIDSALATLSPPMRRIAVFGTEQGWIVTVKINCGCCACVGEYFRVWATDAPICNTPDRSMYATTKD